jgi:threonine/homoserine efflux transporter RhtA
MSTFFENPANGYKEGVSSIAWLWCLLFGFFYFAVKGAWRHALLGIIFAVLTAGISWLIYPFFAKKIVINHYRRMGWREV